MGSLIFLNSLWLIAVDPHRCGSISLRPVWALAAGATARGFFRDPRAGRATAEKGVGDGTCAQGCAGASASEHSRPTAFDSGKPPDLAETKAEGTFVFFYLRP
jgi:hypothetical protein